MIPKPDWELVRETHTYRLEDCIALSMGWDPSAPITGLDRIYDAASALCFDVPGPDGDEANRRLKFLIKKIAPHGPLEPIPNLAKKPDENAKPIGMALYELAVRTTFIRLADFVAFAVGKAWEMPPELAVIAASNGRHDSQRKAEAVAALSEIMKRGGLTEITEKSAVTLLEGHPARFTQVEAKEAAIALSGKKKRGRPAGSTKKRIAQN